MSNTQQAPTLFDLHEEPPTGIGKADFDGPVYDPKFDKARLTGQIRDVFRLMKDGVWRTLDEIAVATHHPHASISAQLRHLRKVKFGSHVVNKQPRGDRENGLWEYQLLVNSEVDDGREQ